MNFLYFKGTFNKARIQEKILIQKKNQKIADYIPYFVRLFISGLMAFGLAAFFTLPVLFETKLVQVESMFTGYYTYSIHFVSLKQLFISNFWGDGPSVWGPNDGLSFAVGYLHWLIPLLICIFILIKKIRKISLSKLDCLVLTLSVMLLGTIFMTHERSTFIWKLLPPIQKIQFPWRFLNIVTVLSSLISGYIAVLFKRHSKQVPLSYILYSLTIILLIALNISHYTPVHFGPITDSQKFSGKAWNNQITSGIYDYLPKTASTAPKSAAKDVVDEIFPANAKYTLAGVKKGTDWSLFNLTLEQNSKVYLSTLAFPDFQIIDNGNPISYKIEPELGRISLDLAPGTHQIYLHLRNTPIRTIANYISLFSLIVVVLLAFSAPWKKSTSLK